MKKTFSGNELHKRKKNLPETIHERDKKHKMHRTLKAFLLHLHAEKHDKTNRIMQHFCTKNVPTGTAQKKKNCLTNKKSQVILNGNVKLNGTERKLKCSRQK